MEQAGHRLWVRLLAGVQLAAVPVQQVHDDAVRPAEAQLHVVLAAGAVPAEMRSVVLQFQTNPRD